ncbi:hypothetical protein BYT27DRAFT_7313649 [Phlegmacium glaucopus]|nr:hypothetical protein BYT27DRAFT_7313649 [Phlegmacium glaucopus]
MPLTRIGKKKVSPPLSPAGSPSPAPTPTSHKRATSVSMADSSESEYASDDANASEAVSVSEETQKLMEKRKRRQSEKALYMSGSPTKSTVVRDKKRTPVEASPDTQSPKRKIKLKPIDSHSFLVEISSDEEENTTPTPKAKRVLGTPANCKVASTPSRLKPYMSVSGSYRKDQPVLDDDERTVPRTPDPAPPCVTSDDDLPAGILQNTPKPGSLSTEPAEHKQPGQLPVFVQSPSDACFLIVPAKVDLRAEYCPSGFLVDSCPMELGSGAFEYFDEIINRNLDSAVSFKQFQPFASVDAIAVSDVSVDNFRHDVLWEGSHKPVVFSMLSSVHASNIIQPLQLKNYKIKGLTVVPYGDSWHGFEAFLGGLYGPGEMQGPFEYGCLLKLTSRREGGYGGTSSLVPSTPTTTPRKNLKAFASSRTKTSTLWFDRKQPSCMNFTDDIPIYDASKHPFLFQRDDFASMQGLPCYQKYGVRSPCDLPHQALVSVFFTLNTYAKDYNSSASITPQNGTGGPDAPSAAVVPTYRNSLLPPSSNSSIASRLWPPSPSTSLCLNCSILPLQEVSATHSCPKSWYISQPLVGSLAPVPLDDNLALAPVDVDVYLPAFSAATHSCPKSWYISQPLVGSLAPVPLDDNLALAPVDVDVYLPAFSAATHSCPKSWYISQPLVGSLAPVPLDDNRFLALALVDVNIDLPALSATPCTCPCNSLAPAPLDVNCDDCLPASCAAIYAHPMDLSVLKLGCFAATYARPGNLSNPQQPSRVSSLVPFGIDDVNIFAATRKYPGSLSIFQRLSRFLALAQAQSFIQCPRISPNGRLPNFILKLFFVSSIVRSQLTSLPLKPSIVYCTGMNLLIDCIC